MLCEITIENVAVIEKATAEFGEGFTVLTGETGAGKSILIDSINAILGNRTSRDIVRSGAQKAKIWARFTAVPATLVAMLGEAGYEVEDELLVYREVGADGKTTCRINGMPCTAAFLREVCGGLINIHGQHDNQSLLNPAKHLETLDAFAQNDDLLEEYQKHYTTLQVLRGEMDALQMDEEEKNRRLELLRYEVDEIVSAELAKDEEELLVEKRNVIRNSQHILEALNAAYLALAGGDEDTGAKDLLCEAANLVTSAAGYAGELEEYAGTLNELYYTAGEIASDIQDRLTRFEFDGETLDALESRLDLIYRLKNKYGPTVAAIIEYGEKAAGELEKIEFASERLAVLSQEADTLLDKTQMLANRLTQTRHEAFERLRDDITSALAFLNMPGITMSLQAAKTQLGKTGQDSLEFYISTNPGEVPKPLAKIASGGELARIMLAIKSALAQRDLVPTVIYDEIDTGISGMAAGRIGQLLQKTAVGRQVICVTHTAQVAAFADRHLLIQKQVEDGRTFTHIETLTFAQRVEELSRIMSGDAVSDTTRASATEMLERAFCEPA